MAACFVWRDYPGSQKVMHFLIHSVPKGFPSARCPLRFV
uniref:Uncharacterized protein n=1 Tax=Rhizophora mucronata TaxID=61149 RepID=A0A2P2K4C7_RHIMU